MKTLDGTKSGARGDIVASRNRFGPHERQRVRHVKGRTPAQRGEGEGFGQVSSGWDALTEEERQLWLRDAPQYCTRRRNGKTHPLTGQLLYQKLNRARAKLGLPALRVPTRRPEFPPNPVGPLSITYTAKGVALMLSVSELPAGHIMVFGSPPWKAGRYYCRNFTYLGLLPAPKGGYSEITELWLKTHGKRYGMPRPGWRIFIYTKQQIDGWEGKALQTSAVVPPRPAKAARPQAPARQSGGAIESPRKQR